MCVCVCVCEVQMLMDTMYCHDGVFCFSFAFFWVLMVSDLFLYCNGPNMNRNDDDNGIVKKNLSTFSTSSFILFFLI